jgi:hypothetical protein
MKKKYFKTTQERPGTVRRGALYYRLLLDSRSAAAHFYCSARLKSSMMLANVVDVAIIGAGPYGMSIAAHLRARGISYRIFGEPMQFWREMPPAMFLKSLGTATNICTPDNRFPFAKYSKDRGLEPDEPCAIADFARYGIFVQQAAVPEVEPIEVIHVARNAESFEITLSNTENFIARHVVVAIGLKAFARMPQEVLALSSELASHTCHHASFERFRGKRVFVLGAGQSALQAAALLHEAGAQVEVLVRKSEIDFSSRMPSQRSLFERLRRPRSGLGPGLKTWVLDTFPGALYFMPDRWRVPFVRSFLGPSVAWWLRERVTDKFPIHMNCSLLGAEARDGRLALRVHHQDRGDYEILCDHIVAGTGFEVDVDRLEFLDARLRQAIARVDRSPRLDRRFQSSVNGLHFVGTMSAMSFGPLFRFVVGAGYTSRVLTRHFAKSTNLPAPTLGMASPEHSIPVCGSGMREAS